MPHEKAATLSYFGFAFFAIVSVISREVLNHNIQAPRQGPPRMGLKPALANFLSRIENKGILQKLINSQADLAG